MCSKDACKSNECCKLLLNLYCQLWQLLIDCPSNGGLETPITMQYLLNNWLTPTLQALYPTTKCGKVNCCDGLAESILCAFQVAISALTTADDGTAGTIFASLAATLTGILTQAGVTPPVYPAYP